ncbi:hypothetical protein C8T65DRAFT_639692 [Cerioporus squamosus]|nr:hypothetical protein C8T65DRAFT_639692 [Cerioporus squamosus]
MFSTWFFLPTAPQRRSAVCRTTTRTYSGLLDPPTYTHCACSSVKNSPMRPREVSNSSRFTWKFSDRRHWRESGTYRACSY